jgi:hypothetical protein
MAITAIVGGWIGAKNGGRNQGLELIQNIIDRDMQAQAADMANRRDMLGMKQSLLGDMAQQSGDLYRAATVKTAASYNWAADAAKALGDSARSDAERMKYYGLADELRMQGADKADAYFAAQEAAKAQAQQQGIENEFTRRRIGLEGARLSEDRRQFNLGLADRAADRFIGQGERAAEREIKGQQAQVDMIKAQAEIGKDAPDAVPGLLLGKDAEPVRIRGKAGSDGEKVLRAQKTESEIFLDDLARFEAAYGANGTEISSQSDGGVKMRQSRARLRDRYAKIMGKGAPSDNDYKVFDEILPDPVGSSGFLGNAMGTQEAIGQLREGVEGDFNTTMRNYTTYTGTENLTYDPTTHRWFKRPDGFKPGVTNVVTPQQRQQGRDDVAKKVANPIGAVLGD